MRRTLFLLPAVLAAVTPVLAGPAGAADRVTIDSGTLQGVAAGPVVAFKGIPFAAPPIGDLRWRAPQPAAKWTGVRPATEYGHDCAQEPFGGDAAPLGTPPDEDCLVLNVWTPVTRTQPALPVLVWIYGGGFVNGGSSPAVYDGTRFAEQGIVFVSFNYRLGRFGFFAHPALTKENPAGPLGNYGYLDQIAALTWVQRNIAAFGGDPKNVTVFGESAGGGSVQMLMVSPLARGLFHKAIVQSGAFRAGGIGSAKKLREPGPKGEPSGEQIGTAFAAKHGITGDDAAALAALRKLPAAVVIDKMNLMSQQADTYAGPMIDGTIMPEDAETAFRAGRQAKVPYLIGANDLEFGFFPTPPDRTDAMLQQLGDLREKALAAYDPEAKGDKGRIGMEISSDTLFVEPARLFARLAAAAGQPVYRYRFAYVAESLRGKVGGALHATEIPFVFNTERAKYGDQTTAKDTALARAAHAYWVAFARTGAPDAPGLPTWPRYAAESDMIVDFTLEGPVVKTDPVKARLDVLEAAAQRGYRRVGAP